jgi:hypothetical protein
MFDKTRKRVNDSLVQPVRNAVMLATIAMVIAIVAIMFAMSANA